MRGEVVQVEGVTVLNDSYNANPVSMRAALAAFGLLEIEGRRHAVLGDMLELGKTSRTLHRELGEELGRSRLDFVWLYGKEMEEAAQAARKTGRKGMVVRHATSLEEIAEELAESVHTGDGVLIKGSRGMGPERAMEVLKQRQEKKD